jgi:thiosulfate reductase cytochrome b subunit
MREITALMGGFEAARRVHFFAMTALVLFIVAHVAMALFYKDTLVSMVTGGREKTQ